MARLMCQFQQVGRGRRGLSCRMKRFLCLLALLACEVDASTYDCATFELQIFGNTICSGRPGVASRIPAGTCVPTPREVRTGRYFETSYDHWGIQHWDIYSVNAHSGYGKRACEASLKAEGIVTNLGKCNLADPNRGSAWKVVCAPSSASSKSSKSSAPSSDDNTAIIVGAVSAGVGTLLLLLAVGLVFFGCKMKKAAAGTSAGQVIQGVAMPVATQPAVQPQPQQQGVVSDTVTKLRELKELLDAGVLTQDEFAGQKKAVLASGSASAQRVEHV